MLSPGKRYRCNMNLIDYADIGCVEQITTIIRYKIANIKKINGNRLAVNQYHYKKPFYVNPDTGNNLPSYE